MKPSCRLCFPLFVWSECLGVQAQWRFGCFWRSYLPPPIIRAGASRAADLEGDNMKKEQIQDLLAIFGIAVLFGLIFLFRVLGM